MPRRASPRGRFAAVVEQFQVLPGDARGFGGHRRVDVHLQIAQPAFAGEAVQVIQDLLGAADRERRHDHVASLFVQGALDDLDQFVLVAAMILVRAVAVGGLHDQDVRLLDGRRIAQDRTPRLAEIAAEHELGGLAVFGDPDLDDGRAKDVAGVAEAAAHDRMWREFLVVGDGSHLAQTVARVLHRVERSRRRASAMCRPGVTLGPLGIALLNMRAVGQHHVDQVGGRGDGIDRPLEARTGELRQQTAVVDVRMGQQYEIDGSRVECERLAVARRRLATALDHAAVHQEASVRGLHQVARAGDFARRAEKGDFHCLSFVMALVAVMPLCIAPQQPT